MLINTKKRNHFTLKMFSTRKTSLLVLLDVYYHLLLFFSHFNLRLLHFDSWEGEIRFVQMKLRRTSIGSDRIEIM